jgi:hypothetical protein
MPTKTIDTIEIYIGQRRFHQQSNPTSFSVLGWLKLLDGQPITDLVIASSTAQLRLSACRDDIRVFFSSDGEPTSRNLTVSRFVAMELALFFLSHEELPTRMMV